MSEFSPGQHVRLYNTHPGDGGWSTAYIETKAGSSYGVRVQGHSFYWVTADKLESLEQRPGSTEWIVGKPARELKPGDRIVFTDAMGGEGETLTVDGISNSFGTIEIATEELDFELMATEHQWITLAPEEGK